MAENNIWTNWKITVFCLYVQSHGGRTINTSIEWGWVWLVGWLADDLHRVINEATSTTINSCLETSHDKCLSEARSPPDLVEKSVLSMRHWATKAGKLCSPASGHPKVSCWSSVYFVLSHLQQLQPRWRVGRWRWLISKPPTEGHQSFIKHVVSSFVYKRYEQYSWRCWWKLVIR